MLLRLHGQSWNEKYGAPSDRHDENPSSDTTWSLGNQRSRPCSTSSEGLIELIDEAPRPRPPGRLRRSVSLRSADDFRFMIYDF